MRKVAKKVCKLSLFSQLSAPIKSGVTNGGLNDVNVFLCDGGVLPLMTLSLFVERLGASSCSTCLFLFRSLFRRYL